MCRFVAYLGKPILADRLIVKPKNSLLRQSRHATEAESLVNGDGFGIGWYKPSIRSAPAVFNSIRPAWNDNNIQYNAAMIKTKCLLAHVRAATHGAVSLENCHPFHYKEFLMMQNGGIGDFIKIKRKLINRLDEELFQWINGQTDTQYLFALILTIIKEKQLTDRLTPEDVKLCLSQAFTEIEEMKRSAGLSSPSVYNLVFTNGKILIATKYSTQPEIERRSLHIASKVECYIGDNGYLRFRESNVEDHSVLISSEILSPEDTFWQKVPENCCISVNEDLHVLISQIP